MVGSLGSSVQGVFRSHGVSGFSCFCCLSSLPDLNFCKAFLVFLHSGFGRFFLLDNSMAKESSRTRSHAVKRLQPYNRSPSGRSRDGRDAGAEHGDSSRDSVHSQSSPPGWAKVLLKKQHENAAELKRKRKVRGYLCSCTNIFFLLRNVDGTQSLVTPPICSPETRMTKRKSVKL